jgi:hypothetical protein
MTPGVDDWQQLIKIIDMGPDNGLYQPFTLFPAGEQFVARTSQKVRVIQAAALHFVGENNEVFVSRTCQQGQEDYSAFMDLLKGMSAESVERLVGYGDVPSAIAQEIFSRGLDGLHAAVWTAQERLGTSQLPVLFVTYMKHANAAWVDVWVPIGTPVKLLWTFFMERLAKSKF